MQIAGRESDRLIGYMLPPAVFNCALGWYAQPRSQISARGLRAIRLGTPAFPPNLDTKLPKERSMKTRAAVAFEARKPLEIVELDLEGAKAGEVLVEIKATGICHTDAYTLDGFDSEGIFPLILGHEGA